MYDIDKLDSSVRIGNQNDNNAVIIQFDVESWVEEFPIGEFKIEFMPYESDVA